MRFNHRWFRFSLKTFLVVITGICIFLAVVVKRAHDRRTAISAIDAWGAGYTIDILTPDWTLEYVRNNKWFYEIYRVTISPKCAGYDPEHPFDDQALLRLIPFLNRFSHLRVLYFPGTAITDQGLSHLKRINILNELDLSDTRISDAGLDFLAKLGTLTRIEIRGTRVTSQGVAHFQAANPNCKVIWDGE